MNTFEALLRARPPLATVCEINRQPEAWRKTLSSLEARREKIAAFLSSAGVGTANSPTLVLTGAGSSEWAARSAESVLRTRLGCEVATVSSSHLVTHCERIFLPHRDYLLISFTRSGNSPESVAAFQHVESRFPRVMQMVITCAEDGNLARLARNSPTALLVLLPRETNDMSVAVTGSFSCLALAGLFLSSARSGELARPVEVASRAVRRILETHADRISEFARGGFARACFLGSDTRHATMHEGSLKMQEMTGGRVASACDTYLGLRHGPQLFVNRDCIVVASLSSEARSRRYELDLLRELKSKRQGCGTLVICGRVESEVTETGDAVIDLFPSGEPIDDDFRALTDVVPCQVLATFKSLDLGLSPDNPSPDGIINKVVEGVTIYPWP